MLARNIIYQAYILCYLHIYYGDIPPAEVGNLPYLFQVSNHQSPYNMAGAEIPLRLESFRSETMVPYPRIWHIL